MSQRRVCGLLVLAESSYRYRSCRKDAELRQRLTEAAREKPRWGYRRLQIVLDQTGEHGNHKRVYRVYREAGLPRRKITAWRKEYNEARPHSSLGYETPSAFARRMAALRSPSAPSAPPFGQLPQAEAIHSGGSNVV
ncbi:MAG: IS3 family transposase [Candidatus Acidiferrales bacterium]